MSKNVAENVRVSRKNVKYWSKERQNWHENGQTRFEKRQKR